VKHGIVHAHCTRRRASGFKLIELLVVIGAVVLLAALLLPALAAARRKTSRINCVCHLKQVPVAFRIWESDNGDKYPMQVVLTNNETMKLVTNGNAYLLWQTASNELKTPKVLHCPADKQRTEAVSFSQGFSDANISYFCSLDAVETYPQMILAGDDNLAVDGVPVKPGILNLGSTNTVTWTDERHRRVGNLGMADGSVQQLTSAGLNSAFVNSTNGVPTNAVPPRWVIP
jgi:prepilin-type processing-associated H-X9-DG protein